MIQSEPAMRWETFLLTLKDKYPAMYADYTKKIFVVRDDKADDKYSKRKRKK